MNKITSNNKSKKNSNYVAKKQSKMKGNPKSKDNLPSRKNGQTNKKNSQYSSKGKQSSKIKNSSPGKITNTSPKNVAKSKKSQGYVPLTKTKGKKVHRFKLIFTFLLVITLLISLVALTGTVIFYIKYGKDFTNHQLEAMKLVEESDLDTFRQAETSLVYDSKGNLVSVLKGEKDVYYLPYHEIPGYAVNAMIAIEDKKFHSHEGVDLLANVRAVLALIRNKGDVTQGGSTITQQLARNIFLSNEVSVERKMKEIFIAIELEKKFGKDKIMEFYLNNIYFANGLYGLEAASKGYFNKKSGELTLSQIAFLCAIPNNPTIYDPMDHPEKTKERRDRILLQMYEDGFISTSQYESACEEEIKLVHKKVDKINYVETYVFYSATRALMEREGFIFRNVFADAEDKEEYEEEYNELYNRCQKSLYYEGYRIYTSIDLEKQTLLQKSIDEALAEYNEKNEDGIYTLQGAAVSIDNETGRVIAIVGGRFQETIGYTLNRAYQSYRQPGSVIKPLIVYTPAFEQGYYPEDMVVDEPIKDGPKNSDGRYAGEMTLRRAIEISKNTIAWKLYEELTPSHAIPYLINMNFNNIDKNDYYQAASLGGFTYGVSPLEMAAAFATIENDGIYREPTCIVKILDAKGNVIVREKKSNTTNILASVNNQQTESRNHTDVSNQTLSDNHNNFSNQTDTFNNWEKRIYDTNAARMMTDVLTGVLKNGTGKRLGLDNMSCAGKTGTTSGKKDGWFVGYTPYYTTSVWVGYDRPKTVDGLSGSSYPGTIWNIFMNEIHEGLENKDFPEYEKLPTKEDKPNAIIEDANNTEDISDAGTLEDTGNMNGVGDNKKNPTDHNTGDLAGTNTLNGTEDINESKDLFGTDDINKSEDFLGSDVTNEFEDSFGSDITNEFEDSFGTDVTDDFEDFFGVDDINEFEDSFGAEDMNEFEDSSFGRDITKEFDDSYGMEE